MTSMMSRSAYGNTDLVYTVKITDTYIKLLSKDTYVIRITYTKWLNFAHKPFIFNHICTHVLLYTYKN